MGIVVTGIVHASAIPISIMALLAQQDLVSLENASAGDYGSEYRHDCYSAFGRNCRNGKR